MAASDKPRISSAKLALAIRRVRAEKEDLDLVASDPIAVIGMGCRFPGGGNSPEEFWTALREGRDGITAIPGWALERCRYASSATPKRRLH